MTDFNGKVVLITGAAGGIGAAVAHRFAEKGANLVLTDLDVGALAAMAARDPAKVLAVQHDVTDFAAAMNVVALGVDKFGGFDIVVTSAGLYRHASFGEMSEETWRAGISVNLDGVFLILRAVLPHLRDGGSIVNIASMAAHRGSREHSQYAAAKSGVLGLTRSLARELAPRIRVNAVSPGLIDTAMMRELPGEQLARLIADTPLGRLGRAYEVADAVLYLSGPGAGFVTGEILHVNGGLHMAG
ncbi:SDR family NAD(P)-dependent oxidoreductase [Aestuariivirga sp. YIM B02566]|uniref:SDR family oxidoreductase n=1 Tax=Taklimakanibacter albus TaxID=2800327 RepID=A0ACC5QYW5_9HYPH|nr:SDR family NAD(P)-dependent oxidoreductase [Aestuariivirga sp. YIM B02566]MBK1865579.1 SDR family oxidoreductase [Aestuariivirga sp. YIM B02566]